MVPLMFNKLSQSRGLWPCDIYMGLSPMYIMRKWWLPNDHNLYLREVIVRWWSYNQFVLWDLINWVNGEFLVSQHSRRPLLLEYLVNITDILGGQYSWCQMWYLKNFKWWISLIFWEANTLDVKCDV